MAGLSFLLGMYDTGGAVVSTPVYESPGSGCILGPGSRRAARPVVHSHSGWSKNGHLENVNCGNPDISGPVSSGSGLQPTSGSRTTETEVSAVAKRSTAYAPNFTVYEREAGHGLTWA